MKLKERGVMNLRKAMRLVIRKELAKMVLREFAKLLSKDGLGRPTTRT